ncbi:MAG TPA: glutamate-5-semialdehyde dehydrogenase [Bacteroidales bacterium]|nr:glutamate-5-semialdehyde dehydrogenase [Bacteroidales bacterium]
MNDLKQKLTFLAGSVKQASRKLARANTMQKDNALKAIADEINKNREILKAENSRDLESGKSKGLSAAFIDRLTLNDKRIDGMIQVLHDVVNLKDPVGEIFNMNTLPNGLKVGQMRVPIGVLAIIFESRPNVCIEVASLTIKSGNGVILRGGSDAIHSNLKLAELIRNGLKSAGLPEECVGIVDNTNRESVLGLVKLKDYIDVIIPRGGLQLIRLVEENSIIPVIRHDMGICHTYVDEFAKQEMALDICYNAKVQRPGVCNAMETLLVNSKVAPVFLPEMKAKFDKAGVKLKGDDKTRKILTGIEPATEEDWNTEYLDLVLSVKVVNSLDEAIDHINVYSSHHSDAIVTDSYENGLRFISEVDSAACFINASTRFSDGNEFGLGAEMGISNQKLHVRGPMGLKDLMAPKYIIFGNGQVRT